MQTYYIYVGGGVGACVRVWMRGSVRAYVGVCVTVKIGYSSIYSDRAMITTVNYGHYLFTLNCSPTGSKNLIFCDAWYK